MLYFPYQPMKTAFFQVLFLAQKRESPDGTF